MSAEQYNLLDRIEAARKASWRKREKPVCKECGATILEYRHKLNEGLALALIRLYRHGSPARLRDLALNQSQFNNWQKLRYWNFIEHAVEGATKGEWQITQVGESFVRAVERAPLYVRTFRGEVKSTEGELVLITELVPGYNWRIDYVREAVAVNQ